MSEGGCGDDLCGPYILYGYVPCIVYYTLYTLDYMFDVICYMYYILGDQRRGDHPVQGGQLSWEGESTQASFNGRLAARTAMDSCSAFYLSQPSETCPIVS